MKKYPKSGIAGPVEFKFTNLKSDRSMRVLFDSITVNGEEYFSNKTFYVEYNVVGNTCFLKIPSFIFPKNNFEEFGIEQGDNYTGPVKICSIPRHLLAKADTSLPATLIGSLDDGVTYKKVDYIPARFEINDTRDKAYGLIFIQTMFPALRPKNLTQFFGTPAEFTLSYELKSPELFN